MSWMISDLVRDFSKPRFWLANRDKSIVSRLSELDNRANFDYNFVEASELSGTIPLMVERNNKEVENKNFTKFKEKMLIKMILMNVEMWFTIESITKVESDGLYLSFHAYSYEHTLNAKRLYETEYESDLAETNFKKVLEQTFWDFTFVDTKLTEKHRGFEFSTNTTVLSALYEMAESYGGIIQFDEVNHTVGLYHEDTLCTFDDLMINQYNYIETLNDERNAQDVTTRLYAIGSEGMTFNTVSPSGQSYTENFSYFMYPYEENEDGNTIKSSHYMSDGLCHNLLRMKKARDLLAPQLEDAFNDIKILQDELIPLEDKEADAQLAHDIVNNRLDVLRANKEYYYKEETNTTFEETVRAGYYVFQARSKKTSTGKITITGDYGAFTLDLTTSWQTRRLDIFEDINFNTDEDKETLKITVTGNVEYMMVRVLKKPPTNGSIVSNTTSTASAISTSNTQTQPIAASPTTFAQASNFLTAVSNYSLQNVTRDYFINAMPDYIDSVKAEMKNTSDEIVIPTITDTHYTENSLRSSGHKIAHERGIEYAKLSIEMANHINIDAIAHTGDMIDGRALPEQSEQELKNIVEAYGVVNKPKILVKGNHDTNYLHYGRSGTNIAANALEADKFLPNTKTKELMSRYWSQDNIQTASLNNDGVYGYVDLHSKKTRIIMLDSYDLNEVLDSKGKRIYSPRSYLGYQQAQLTWLVSTLQSIPNDYDVLVFSHVSITKGYSPDNNEFNVKGVAEILKAFQRKTTVSYKFTHEHFGATVNATFDSSKKGKIIATIAGHQHADLSEHDTLIDSDVPNIVRTCATPAYSGTNLRPIGNVEETAFDTIIINKTERKIKFIRFGLGDDLTISYGSNKDSTGDDGDDGSEGDTSINKPDENGNTILDRQTDHYATDAEILEKYNIMYHEEQLAYAQSMVKYKEFDIEAANQVLQELKEQIAEEKFLTIEQIKEKDMFVFEQYYIEENHIDEKEMYDDTIKKLEELNAPAINMTIDIHNFLNSLEHKRNWEKLKIGKKIRVKHSHLDIYSEAVLSKITFDFDSEDISLTITGTKDIKDPDKELAKLLYDFSNASSTLALKKFIYDDASNKANAAADYMAANLEAARQRIHAGVNESVTISNRGLVIKSIDYPNEVLIATAGVFAISDDGGQTFRTAITAKGVTAEEIVGKILISQKAWIQDDNGIVTIKGDLIEIKDPYGNTKVAIGQYKKDTYGIMMDGGTLEIVNGGLRPEHIDNALDDSIYFVDVNCLDTYDFAFTNEVKTIACKVYNSKKQDITSQISPSAFKWEKFWTQSKLPDTVWNNKMIGKGSTITISFAEAESIIKCTVNGYRNKN